MRRELNFSTLTGRNEEFGFLKKGFKWIFAEGNIVCSGRNHTVHARRQSPRRRFLWKSYDRRIDESKAKRGGREEKKERQQQEKIGNS